MTAADFSVAQIEAAMDFIGVAFHGMAISHLDALCHVFVNEHMYNGYAASDVLSTGSPVNPIAFF